MRYFSEAEAGGSKVLAAALRGLPAPAGQGIDPVQANNLAWDSFFTWLSLPAQTFWVNLNPNEPDRIVDARLGQTDAGRVLLEADFQMKKTVARLIHPDGPSGRVFWDELDSFLEKGGQKPVAFSFRQWNVPGELTVWEAPDSVYIVNLTLDAKLESDYAALKSPAGAGGAAAEVRVDPSVQAYAEGLFRKAILPELIKQVNTTPEYADLWSIFYSRIIAEWYKAQRSGEKGALADLIIGRGDASAWPARTAWEAKEVFDRYVRSFTEGEFKLTRETTKATLSSCAHLSTEEWTSRGSTRPP